MATSASSFHRFSVDSSFLGYPPVSRRCDVHTFFLFLFFFAGFNSALALWKKSGVWLFDSKLYPSATSFLTIVFSMRWIHVFIFLFTVFFFFSLYCSQGETFICTSGNLFSPYFQRDQSAAEEEDDEGETHCMYLERRCLCSGDSAAHLCMCDETL